ncbi:MAG: formylmethanofuran dehydrogenase subunit E family protein [Firmicutes bacterium]|nr:formylmethanofuran dehydrogenase subunit E family protein [Bacillota bacterium]
MDTLEHSCTRDNEPDWYWPRWAAESPYLPTFQVHDTESSHGRYAPGVKTITVKDLVKFHGHACDGLFRGAMALSEGLSTLFSNGVIDRTDLRVLSRNSPCLGDVAAYLTGGRIRFNTQDVRDIPGVWFIVQRISTQETIRAVERPGVYPAELAQWEARLVSQQAATQEDVDGLREAQWQWVRTELLTHEPSTMYVVERLENWQWETVPFLRLGTRTDVLFKEP